MLALDEFLAALESVAAGGAAVNPAAESHMRAVFQKLDLLDDGLSHRRVLAVLAFLTAQEPAYFAL